MPPRVDRSPAMAPSAPTCWSGLTATPSRQQLPASRPGCGPGRSRRARGATRGRTSGDPASRRGFGISTRPSTGVGSAGRQWRLPMRLPPAASRRRGLPSSSIPKFKRTSPPPSTATQSPGGTNHHQASTWRALWLCGPVEHRAERPAVQIGEAEEGERHRGPDRVEHRAHEAGGDEADLVGEDLEEDDPRASTPPSPEPQRRSRGPRTERVWARITRAPHGQPSSPSTRIVATSPAGGGSRAGPRAVAGRAAREDVAEQRQPLVAHTRRGSRRRSRRSPTRRWR